MRNKLRILKIKALKWLVNRLDLWDLHQLNSHISVEIAIRTQEEMAEKIKGEDFITEKEADKLKSLCDKT